MNSEAELVNLCLNNSELLKYFPYDNWEDRWGALELEGFFGRPDLVLAFGKIGKKNRKYLRTFAFEFKLRNWKKALSQAYKYSAFVQYSYVIMSDEHIRPVIRAIELFKKSNIGLISINENGALKLLNKPKLRKPYSEKLCNQFNYILLNEIFSKSELEIQNKFQQKTSWIDIPQDAFGNTFN